MSQLRVADASLALFLTTLPFTAAGQENDKFEIQPRVSTMFHSNFLQAADGAPTENVWANRLEIRIIRKLDDVRDRLKAYGLAERTTYNNAFDASRSLRGGLQLNGQPHVFHFSARRQVNRPAFFIGNEVDTFNLFRLNGEYAYRLTDEFQLGGLFDYYQQTYGISKGLDGNTRFLGASVRYRGFGYSFSPELGIRKGRRNTVDDDNDYSQTEYLVKVRSVASPSVYLSFRYRYRVRDYDTALRRSRNFERRDNRHAFRALATIKWREHFLWDIYFARENADSLRQARAFVTTTFGVGLKFLL